MRVDKLHIDEATDQEDNSQLQVLLELGGFESLLFTEINLGILQARS